MKISVEIELPFIDEDGALHDDTKWEIINRVAQRIEAKMLLDLKPKLDEIVDANINEAVSKILDNYLSKPVVISNGFKKDEYESIYDMVEKKFGALYDTEIKRTSSACGTDPLLTKIDTKIKQAMQTLFSQIETKIDKESKIIAAQTLKESSLYAAMQKLGIKE